MGCKGKTETKETKELTKDKISVGILVYPGVEMLDFTGPAEVFSNARGFQVYTIATVGGALKTNNSVLNINPDFTVDNAPKPDILVIPGGPMEVIMKLGTDQKLMTYLKSVNAKTRFTMSVCTGAGILAKAGILDQKSATSHSGSIDTLQQLFPNTKFLSDVRFVKDGKVVTTAGVSAGIDGALHVVEKIKGTKEALFVTMVMEYDKWKPEAGLVIGGENSMTAMHMDHMVQPQDRKNAAAKDVKEDVVCGMQVSSAKYQSSFDGKTYYFCSSSCKKLFDAHPQLYSKK